ncbi:uncharacterized protein VTP21DRAFT_739 [Calcarisporiella thermophila]|uniref:uncharacterized protein n=1 Tax=Calcarisporiella thermophila TaxID=911321 RepID=UPI003744069E
MNAYKIINRVTNLLGITQPPTFKREIPLFTDEGVTNAERTYHTFITGDKLRLSLTRFKRGAGTCNNVVIFMHGLTTSSDMFIMPEQEVNCVNYFLDNGYTDVWCVDNRISMRWPYNLEVHEYTLDHIAKYDNPKMIETVRKVVGDGPKIHVIAHCVNAMSILMSAAAGVIPDVSTITVNSTGLTPRVTLGAWLKIQLAPLLVNYTMEHISPKFSRERMYTYRRLLGNLVSLFHLECEIPECHMVSFMWSVGFPGVWQHKNLEPKTHARTGDLYGATSYKYDWHIRKCLNAGKIVKWDPNDRQFSNMPNDYLDAATNINIPIFLVTGSKNGVFPRSNDTLYNHMKLRGKQNFHFHIFQEYGHQDVFMGKRVHKDVLPVLKNFITMQSLDKKNIARAGNIEE